MFLSRKLSAVSFVPLAALGVVVSLAAFAVSRGNDPAPSSGPPTGVGTVVKGLHSRVYEDGLLVSEAEAEDFRIIPRRFFVFNVKSLNEAVITNARIKLFERKETGEARKKDDPFGSLFREFTDKENATGVITRAVVKGMEVSIYNTEGLTHHLTAARADLKAGQNQTVFYHAALEHPSSKRVITTEKLLWDAQEREFRIPGEYTGSGPGGAFQGKGVRIDLNFRVRQLAPL